MKTYIAKWPNGTISILQAKNMMELFWELDNEGDPTMTQVFKVNKPFHITTNIINNEIHFEEISGVGACGLKEVFF
jgi:hypothetical protein